MDKLNAPFRYDIVGSFLRPEAIKTARAQYAQGWIALDQLRDVEDVEVAKLIESQKAAGLHAVTDGEFRRRWWHLDWLAGFNGIEVYDFETDGFGVKKVMQSTYVSEPLSFDPTHPFLEGFKRTQEIAGDVPVKQTIAGPNMVTLDSVVLSAQYAANPVYRDLDELREALAKVYQDAIKAFYDAGCRYLQLDDTSWGALFSKRFRDRITACGYDPDKLIDVFGACWAFAASMASSWSTTTSVRETSAPCVSCPRILISAWFWVWSPPRIRSLRMRLLFAIAFTRPRRWSILTACACRLSAASRPPRKATSFPRRISGRS